MGGGKGWLVCVCASMLSISLSCVHSQLWLVPIPSIPSITLTIISTPAASLLQPAVTSTTQAAHGPLAHPCPFQTGPIPQETNSKVPYIQDFIVTQSSPPPILWLSPRISAEKLGIRQGPQDSDHNAVVHRGGENQNDYQGVSEGWGKTATCFALETLLCVYCVTVDT